MVEQLIHVIDKYSRIVRGNQIHGSFYRGSFFCFDLIVDKNTGFVNATKLFEAVGASGSSWLASEGWELSAMWGASPYECTDDRVAGIYVHPKLIMPITCAVSEDFNGFTSMAMGIVMAGHNQSAIDPEDESRIFGVYERVLCELVCNLPRIGSFFFTQQKKLIEIE